MKNKTATFKYIPVLLLLVLLPGCLALNPTAKVTGGSQQNLNEVKQEPYNGPKARIAVARFKDKSAASMGARGWYNPQIGDGMADMLATALMQTNRFIVLDRSILEEIEREQGIGRKPTQIEDADILITAAVTEFQDGASGASGGVGGASGLVGAILGGGFKKAHMAIDIRLVDVSTSRVLSATSVEGSSTDVNIGGMIGGFFLGGAAGTALGGWKNTAKEKALRTVIKTAVDYIVTKTPDNFYRYNQ